MMIVPLLRVILLFMMKKVLMLAQVTHHLPHGEVAGRNMIIGLVGIDLALPARHIVVIDQAGISPVGRGIGIMTKTMVVGSSTRNQDLVIKHQRCHPPMILDSK